MIARIIIGEPRPGEVFVSGDAHPEAVRVRVRQIGDDPSWSVIATWSPVAVGETIQVWERSEDNYTRIFLRGPTGDVPLLSTHEARWLNHFSVEDLLLRGEFDPWLDPGNKPVDPDVPPP